MELEERYARIKKSFETLSDFPEEELAKSRALFHTERGQIVPRRFEVWTCLVGLPLPDDITRAFEDITTRLTTILPAGVRFYRVIPQNYHWELFIIKRPDEEVSSEDLQRATDIFQHVLGQHNPFTMSYKGLLMTPQGVIIVKGYGAFDHIREQLRGRMPFASQQQSNLGHVSLGRILDPLGSERFGQLKRLVEESSSESYGEFTVSQAKYVHERQWYMEDREIIKTIPLGKRP